MIIRALSDSNVFNLLGARSARVTRRASALAAREPERNAVGRAMARATEARPPQAPLPDAATGLRDASVEFNRVLQAIASGLMGRAPAAVSTPGSPAVTMGRLALRISDAGAPSLLETLRAITERTSTIRSSTTPLALDTTTAEARSTLAAAREINELASSVRSSASALTLDLASPEAATVFGATREVNENTSTVRSSAAALNLDTTTAEAASTIQSTAEANSAATSYGSTALTFQNGATATLSGVYTGTGAAAGATLLKVDLGNNVTLGSSPATLKFKIKDQNNNVLFSYSASTRAGDVISLGADIGLSISFAAGPLVSTNLATTTVSTTTPTSVDANATFNNANLNLRPRFENNAQVVAGSFQVNGTAVTVNAGDTINTLLARIGSVVPGVTASFANDQVTLSTTGNSEQAIVLSNDTSGFLAAVKLAGATTVTGNVHDDVQALGEVTQFASVTDGAFSVNGVSVSVNRTSDSLQTVIARVNASAAGVTASYDAAAKKLVFTPNTAGATLNLSGDTSGLLAAAGVSQGAVGTKVDVNAAFNGSPLFDAGVSVGSGSFKINDVTISVAASDSVAGVMAKINASAAGVTASYDAATDKVKLTANTNSTAPIVMGTDTSGFLAAVKLTSGTGAATTAGFAQTDNEYLARTGQFAAVANGSFQVNGVSISVNAATDSLQTVISRVNAAGAGVTASLDRSAKKLVFTPNTAGAALELAGDTSGLLAAANVSQGIQGTRVNPDAAFNGTGSGSPLFDSGVTVGAGTFTVNGATIAVTASDTVNSVLGKINASAAGVTAAYDAAADKVTLTSNANTRVAISIGADSSGFVAAVKLTGATGVVNTAGFVRGDRELFAESTVFSSVATGSFQVNGVNIAVDRAADTLQTVIGRINASGAGVTASYDAVASRLVFTPNVAGATLNLDGDTSGLLAVANVAAGIQGTQVNRDAAFNGTGTGSPLFDDGFAVTTGAFKVNGVNIAVAANDTVNTMLTKIGAAGAGVTAAFDAATQTIKLTTTTNTAAPVTVSDDSSGFLQAVKLASGTRSTAGRAPVIAQSPDTLIAASPDLTSVTAGTITINGQTVSVTPGTQTARAVIASLDQLAGVRATIDAGTGAIRLASRQDGGNLAISDTSGLLAALGLARGNLRGEAPGLGVDPTAAVREELGDPRADADRLTAAVGRLNQALAAVHRRAAATGTLPGKVVADLKSDAGALAAATGGALSVDNNVAPTLRLDAGALGQLLGKEGAQVRPALDKLGRVAEALQGSVDRAESEKSGRAEDTRLRAGASRERVQLHPAIADALDRERQAHVTTAALRSVPRLPTVADGSLLAARKAGRAYASAVSFATPEPAKASPSIEHQIVISDRFAAR